MDPFVFLVRQVLVAVSLLAPAAVPQRTSVLDREKRSDTMPATTHSNGNKTLLPPISAVPTSALLSEPRQDNEGFSPTPAYGAFVPVDEFFPLGGGGGGNDWGEVRGFLGLTSPSLFMCMYLQRKRGSL